MIIIIKLQKSYSVGDALSKSEYHVFAITQFCPILTIKQNSYEIETHFFFT